MVNNAIHSWLVKKVKPASVTEIVEQLAVEEPLEIVLWYSTTNGQGRKNIAVTMRTPGSDEDLAIGFLFTEGIITSGRQVQAVLHNRQDDNQIIVTLHENEKPDISQASRNFFSSAACGICGKISKEQVMTHPQNMAGENNFNITAACIYGLPAQLSSVQDIFSQTGGLHAAALFDLKGKLILLREDIGRHNAVDKIIGAMLMEKQTRFTEVILVLSGRAGFELVQKAAVAGIRFIASIGAPSSMAVEMAYEYGITLIGFLKSDRFNIYCGADHVQL
jgi:FdhD protein